MLHLFTGVLALYMLKMIKISKILREDIHTTATAVTTNFTPIFKEFSQRHFKRSVAQVDVSTKKRWGRDLGVSTLYYIPMGIPRIQTWAFLIIQPRNHILADYPVGPGLHYPQHSFYLVLQWIMPQPPAKFTLVKAAILHMLVK